MTKTYLMLEYQIAKDMCQTQNIHNMILMTNTIGKFDINIISYHLFKNIIILY